MQTTRDNSTEEAFGRAAAAIDVGYSYRTAKKLEQFKSDPVLGYRTAGSRAEREAGEFLLDEMRRIGLIADKHAVTVDGWEFGGAFLTYDDPTAEKRGDETSRPTRIVRLGGYQTDLVAHDLPTFIVDVGRGTAADYAGRDVRGKLALVHINQRDEWWINYPALQARRAGALAVVAVQDRGYAEVDPAALNAQDICGPSDAPAFSVSRAGADALIAAMKSGEPAVRLTCDSRVLPQTTTYNIVGTLAADAASPVKNELIVVSAHYDSYFSGFQDDNTGVSMLLALAQALALSGYKPRRTLVFVAFAAEEWGRIDSRYDWSAGAWAELGRGGLAGRAVADINLELPAYSHGKRHYIRSVWEYKRFLQEFLKGLDTEVAKLYPEGVGVVCPVQTWSDDFAMAVGGVPSLVNEFSSGSFMETHYHSQFDNEAYYDEQIYVFHHMLYLRLLLTFDRAALPPLDFGARCRRLAATLTNTHLPFAAEKAFRRAAAEAAASGERLYADIMKYDRGGGRGDAALTRELLGIFKFCEDEFVRLDWYEKSLAPHENAQRNLEFLRRAVSALAESDTDAAVAALVEVDDNSYAEAFDCGVTEYFTSRALADRGSWGSGRLDGHVDLFGVMRSLKAKRGRRRASCAAEIKILRAAISAEQKKLDRQVRQETAALAVLKKRLDSAAAGVRKLGRSCR